MFVGLLCLTYLVLKYGFGVRFIQPYWDVIVPFLALYILNDWFVARREVKVNNG